MCCKDMLDGLREVVEARMYLIASFLNQELNSKAAELGGDAGPLVWPPLESQKDQWQAVLRDLSETEGEAASQEASGSSAAGSQPEDEEQGILAQLFAAYEDWSTGDPEEAKAAAAEKLLEDTSTIAKAKAVLFLAEDAARVARRGAIFGDDKAMLDYTADRIEMALASLKVPAPNTNQLCLPPTQT